MFTPSHAKIKNIEDKFSCWNIIFKNFSGEFNMKPGKIKMGDFVSS